MSRNECACEEESLRSSVRRTALRAIRRRRNQSGDCGHIGGSGKSRSSRGRPTAFRARSAGSAPGSSRDATAGSRPQSFGKVVETSREAGSKYRASLVPVMDDWKRRMPEAAVGLRSHSVLQSHLPVQVHPQTRCKGFLPVRFTIQSPSLHRKRCQSTTLSLQNKWGTWDLLL